MLRRSLLVLLAGCANHPVPTSSAAPASSAVPMTTTAAESPPGTDAHAEHGRMGTHGMVIFGSPSHAFLSHIPTFGKPHDVQLVLAGAIRFDDVPGLRAALPASFSEASYTFVPEKLSLDALRAGAVPEMAGRLFVGNFENGGTALPAHARFTVSRVVSQRVLDAAAGPAELTYLLVGSRERTFALHRIGTAPSFDEVLHVELSGDVPSDPVLAAGVLATAPVADDPGERIGRRSAKAKLSAGGSSFEMTRKYELSCLRGPDFDAPCP